MKLLLVDDHALFREGLRLLILQHAQTAALPALEVHEAGSLREAADVMRRHPDLGLVLLDLTLTDHHGLDTLTAWRRLAPLVPVVVLSADERVDVVMSAIDAGALGFIPKTARAVEMQRALECVLTGGVYLPDLPHAANDSGFVTLDDGVGGVGDVGAADLGLSARQLDVLRLLLEGKPNKEICRRLALSESTVKTHLAAIFRKLRVNTRTQAVVAVAQRGIRLAPASPHPHVC
ncbi:response regulator [Aquabacterium fontiphilum]|jgi:DNA-binding NarL/FixJ family response regulator|uniref:response regulator transcription factor n=1 Tax=Aquabacterium fontiphilum TaxID=450365 RepID=UPI001378EFCD|nr:response regulator transcription factor [Aquabacterium fontiphilum]NBD19402.1 response regulator [Aquabacterium fontiphilum]